MKRMRRLLVVALSIIVIITSLYIFWLSPRYLVPILMYHHFGDKGGSLYVTPENFERQMAYLKDKNYNVISLDELVEGIKSNKKFAHNTVVITVDDGTRDNYTYFYPTLKKYGYPATIFIIANFMDREKDYLTWDQVNEMAQNGISFGGHTRNNVYLPSIEDKNVRWDEISGCKKLIESRLRAPVDYYCYPTGGFTEGVKETVKRAGYKGACTTNRGFAELNKDIYELKRVKVKNCDASKPFSFWAKLSGYYNLFRSRKAGN